MGRMGAGAVVGRSARPHRAGAGACTGAAPPAATPAPEVRPTAAEVAPPPKGLGRVWSPMSRSRRLAWRVRRLRPRRTRGRPAGRGIWFAVTSKPGRGRTPRRWLAMPEFYGDRLVFHGRSRSLASVMREKGTIARRWPERDYRPRPGDLRIPLRSRRFGLPRDCTLVDFDARGRGRKPRRDDARDRSAFHGRPARHRGRDEPRRRTFAGDRR